MDKDFIEILISVFMGAIGQIILKLGANKLGAVTFSTKTIIKDIFNILILPEILIGLLFFGGSFLLWVKVLAKADLSYAYPMVSLGYILVVFMSRFLFNEPFNINKIMGIAMIILGVFIINK